MFVQTISSPKAQTVTPKSEIEKAVDLLNQRAAMARNKVHTGLLQPLDTMLSAKLYTATLPPQIEVTHDGQYSDSKVIEAVSKFLLDNNWGFGVRVGSPFAMNSGTIG